ncbi:hypothetical protein CTI12_AA247790 [Artemisia annua]|uniref:Uncharacterized protein n=1 Tax=Artemisia annua TaxID=35608 RepID=A0A2U1MKD7_ARTAN|nr:hypothetical protein CTI12_AA247790 [Artemisia annua]
MNSYRKRRPGITAFSYAPLSRSFGVEFGIGGVLPPLLTSPSWTLFLGISASLKTNGGSNYFRLFALLLFGIFGIGGTKFAMRHQKMRELLSVMKTFSL